MMAFRHTYHTVSIFILLHITCLIMTNTEQMPTFRKFGLTYRDCLRVCNETPACLLSAYTRRYFMCQLFTEYNTNRRVGGIRIHEKLETPRPVECLNCSPNEKCLSRDDGTHVCMADSCEQPEIRTGTTTLGNMYSFGAKVKYECSHEYISIGTVNVSASKIITCSSNGAWTTLGLFCTCVPPKIPHGHVMISTTSDGIKEVIVTCDQGFELRQTQIPTCNPQTNVWVYVDDVYCDKIINGQWKKIYSFPKDADPTTPIFQQWNKANLTGYTKYSYRNDAFIDNWEDQHIEQVKLSVISNDTEAAYIVFDGRDSDSRTWFEKHRLLYSSWADLQHSTDIEFISWFGISAYETGVTVNLRHYINKVYDETSCEGNWGWFVVTWNYFPCDGSYLRPIILYSKTSTASKYLNNEIGVADRFEIWVK